MSSASSPPPQKIMKTAGSPPPFSALSRSTSVGAKISLAPSLKPSPRGSSGESSYGSPSKGIARNGFNGSASTSKQNGAKKLVIKNQRTRPAASSSSSSDPSSDFATHALQTLVRAARAILSTPPEPTPESLQALYSLCEGVVSSSASSSSKGGVAQTLYDRIRIEVERKVGESAQMLRALDTSYGESWLGELHRTWMAFNEKMLMVRSVFLHLDRTFILQTPGLLSLWDMGLDIFRHSIIEDRELGARITRELLQLINKERDGTTISRPVLTQLLGLLQTISSVSHSTVFVSPFMASSTAYYQMEGQRLLSSSEPIDAAAASAGQGMEVWTYLRHVQRRLQEEGERCDLVIGNAVKGPILRVVEDTLVGAHTADLLQRGLAPMIEQEKSEDLATMYSLFSRVSAIPEMRTAFNAYVKEKGTALVSDPTKDETLVTSLIAFQDTLTSLIATSFASDDIFRSAMRDGFAVFINKRQNKPAEMIAKFIDAKMKSGNKSMTDEELESTFRSVLILFRYCQGKDIFEAFYKKDFAKRLLLNRSASSDAEKSMLLKLKEECGPGFTAKLETMAKDIDLSADIMKAFKEHAPPATSSLLSLNILTAGNWPTYHKQPCRIPNDLQKELDRFTLFYKAKYAGRSLAYMHSLDYMTLKADFSKSKQKKELNVSLHQALCLLIFNGREEDEEVPFSEIMAVTGLEAKEAKRTLQSLACAKHKVLTKHPKGRDVDDTDTFSFNASFKDEKYRLKINQIQQKETVEEAKATEKQVLLDRQSHLQLVIVRIMKSRKTMKHTELVMETVNALKERFKVEVSETKKAIESLIDRDYMERAEQTGVYNYLA